MDVTGKCLLNANFRIAPAREHLESSWQATRCNEDPMIKRYFNWNCCYPKWQPRQEASDIGRSGVGPLRIYYYVSHLFAPQSGVKEEDHRGRHEGLSIAGRVGSYGAHRSRCKGGLMNVELVLLVLLGLIAEVDEPAIEILSGGST